MECAGLDCAFRWHLRGRLFLSSLLFLFFHHGSWSFSLFSRSLNRPLRHRFWERRFGVAEVRDLVLWTGSDRQDPRSRIAATLSRPTRARDKLAPADEPAATFTDPRLLALCLLQCLLSCRVTGNLQRSWSSPWNLSQVVLKLVGLCLFHLP